MCNVNGNRELVCTVGDLTPGQRFRTPEGTTLLVLTIESKMDDCTRMADITTGEVRSIGNTVKLGRDRQDRLYASRYLNPAPADAVAAQDADDGLAKDGDELCDGATKGSPQTNPPVSE